MTGFRSIGVAALALFVLLGLAACRQAPVEPEPEWTAELTLDRAAVGDSVLVRTPAGGAASTAVLFGGTQLTGLEAADDDLSLRFTVPEVSPGVVSVQLQNGEDAVSGKLEVLGTGDVGELLLVLPPSLVLDDLNAILAGYGLEPVTSPLQPLTPDGSALDAFSACLGQLALIRVPDGYPSVGELLAELEANDQIWGADPKSEWGLSAAGPGDLSSGTGLAQVRPDLDGSGVTIAVLDTGVSDNIGELADRLLPQLDMLGMGETGDPYVDANGDNVGHGTAVAALAAQAGSGLATGSFVLPVRVCDENGTCLASDVLRGVCSALAEVDPADGLVLNLSLGGDSEVRALTLLLQEATARGAVVVAAAGNKADAPPHWPAAGSPGNPGLLAAGALAIDGVTALPSDFPQPFEQSFTLEDFGTITPLPGPSGYLSATGDSVELYQAGLLLDPESPVTALRLELQLPGTSYVPAPFEIATGDVSLQVDQSLLATEPLFQDGILVQALSPDPYRLELLIDPLPGSVTITAEYLAITALEFLTVEAAPGGYTAGDYISLAAPAHRIASIDPSGEPRQDYSGTSFAAPQLSAAAALLLQEQLAAGTAPDAEAVASRLITGAQAVPDADPTLVGAGRLDLRFLYPTAP